MSSPNVTKHGSRKLFEAEFDAMNSLLNMDASMMNLQDGGSSRVQRDVRRNCSRRVDEPSLYPSLQMILAIPQIDADKIFSKLDFHQQHIVRAIDNFSSSSSEHALNKTPHQNSLRRLLTSGQRTESPFRSSSNRSLVSGDHMSTSSDHAKLAMKQCNNKSWSSRESDKSSTRETSKWRSSKEYLPSDNDFSDDCYYDKQQSLPKSTSSTLKDFSSYSAYGTSMEDFNAKMKARAVPTPLSSAPAPTSSRLQIEVTHGVFMNVLGSAETCVAIQANYLAHTYCICCNLALYCIRDAGYVLCPDCRVVSPVEMGDDNLTNISATVGLGITSSDLAQWQSELNCDRQQSYPQIH